MQVKILFPAPSTSAINILRVRWLTSSLPWTPIELRKGHTPSNGIDTAKDITYKVAFVSLDYEFLGLDNVGLPTLEDKRLREKQTAHQHTLG